MRGPTDEPHCANCEHYGARAYMTAIGRVSHYKITCSAIPFERDNSFCADQTPDECPYLADKNRNDNPTELGWSTEAPTETGWYIVLRPGKKRGTIPSFAFWDDNSRGWYDRLKMAVHNIICWHDCPALPQSIITEYYQGGRI